MEVSGLHDSIQALFHVSSIFGLFVSLVKMRQLLEFKKRIRRTLIIASGRMKLKKKVKTSSRNVAHASMICHQEEGINSAVEKRSKGL